MMSPAHGSTTTVQRAAVANKRNARELSRIGLSREAAASAAPMREPAAAANRRKAGTELSLIGLRGETVAQATHRPDHVSRDFLPQAADEDLDGIAVAIEVLDVEVLDKLG